MARIVRRIKIQSDLAELIFDSDQPNPGQPVVRMQGQVYGPFDRVGRVPVWKLMAYAEPAEELRTGRRSHQELTEQAVFFGKGPPPAPATPADYENWAARKAETWKLIAQFLSPVDPREIDRLHARQTHS